MSNEENQEKQVNPEEEIEELEPDEAAKLIASRLTRTEMIQVACALDADAENGEDEFYDTFQEETKKVAPEIFAGLEESGDEDESDESESDDSDEQDESED